MYFVSLRLAFSLRTHLEVKEYCDGRSSLINIRNVFCWIQPDNIHETVYDCRTFTFKLPSAYSKNAKQICN